MFAGEVTQIEQLQPIGNEHSQSVWRTSFMQICVSRVTAPGLSDGVFLE